MRTYTLWKDRYKHIKVHNTNNFDPNFQTD